MHLSPTRGERGNIVALDEVRLLPPVIPPTFYAAGINYLQHVRNAAARGLPVQVPKQADIGYRAVNALVGNDAPIVVPADSSGKLQFEGELAVVIGREARNLSETDALSCVFGYTIGNDVSERAWQKSDRTFWRAKNADTFKPMGPWIETEVDLDALVTTVHLNGAEVSRFKTNDMIFGIAEYISVMTRYLTLYPGDVIWMVPTISHARHGRRGHRRSNDRRHRHAAQSRGGGELTCGIHKQRCSHRAI